MITGVCLVKNQANTIGLSLESVSHVVDEYYVIDNGSTDRTRDVAESRLDDLGLPYEITSRPGNAGDLMKDLLDRADDYALRVEGDQIHFPDRIETLVSYRERGTTVSYCSRLIQNRLDRQNKYYPTNPPHPMIYDTTQEIIRPPGMIWPRAKNRNAVPYETVGNVNVRVQNPLLRLLRWHRTGGYGNNGKWWNRPPTAEEIPDRFLVEEVETPYEDHFTIREYARLLRERGKGSIQWEGDDLQEVAENFVEWDTRENTEPYEGDYPPLLAEWIADHGYTGFENHLPI